MFETSLIINDKFLSLTLFQRQSGRGVKSRGHTFFFSKLIGKYLLKSPWAEFSFLIKLTEWPFTFAFGFTSYYFKIAALKNVKKVIGKHLWWAFFSKVSVCNFTIKGPQQWKRILKNKYSRNSQKKVNRTTIKGVWDSCFVVSLINAAALTFHFISEV